MAEPVQSATNEALLLVATRLGADGAIPWLLAGAAAQMLGGVEGVAPRELLLLTGVAEAARMAALLGGDEVEPLAVRPAEGFAPSPRGRYALPLAGGRSVPVEVVGDALAVGRAGKVSLALERVWPLRVPVKVDATIFWAVPLEVELAVALVQGRATEAGRIASYLQARGAEWERLDSILAQAPALEEPLWELMDVVRPLAKRARGRRKRQQIGWGGRRR